MEWYLTWWRFTIYRKIKELECALWSGIVKSHLFKPLKTFNSRSSWSLSGCLRCSEASLRPLAALTLINRQKNREKNGFRWSITVGHEGHSQVLIVQHGATCNILTSPLRLTTLSLQSDFFNFWEQDKRHFAMLMQHLSKYDWLRCPVDLWPQY